MKLVVRTVNKNYNVIFEHNILDHINDYYFFSGKKVMIVTDDGVPSFYSEKIASQINNSFVITLRQGEQTKSLESFEYLNKILLEHNFSRNDVLIALGGGVIGDLCGFVSSTFKRGIKFVNIPTTSLSQIDSSVGGKTAINFNGVKNIIGSFYQPEVVLIDFDTLKTLSSRHLNNGLIEALKMGLILDRELYYIFKENKQFERIEEVIFRSVKAKISVVEQDEKESYYRMVLNFGHTLAHGFESIFNLEGIYHGEAVANGMLYMIDNKELQKDVHRIMSNLNIPFVGDYNIDKMFSYLINDKKAEDNSINIVIVKTEGNGEITKISLDELKKRIVGEKNEFNNW